MNADTTRDSLFDGALALFQPARGHRAGTDAVLLAAACPANVSTVCDIGSGVGTVGLRVAQILPEARVALVEVDPALHALANVNIAENGLAGRVDAHCADVLSKPFARGETGPGLRSAEIVLTNPPFLDASNARLSPDPGRRRAHTLENGLVGWIAAARSRLASHGRLIVIHRADAALRLANALGKDMGDVRLRFVHPRVDHPAHRVLLCARQGSRAPMSVLPPLVLHGADGAFTCESADIHAGRGNIGWEL